MSQHVAQRVLLTESNLESSVGSTRPYVLILPGILGERAWDRNIALGFERSGYGCDVEIYDWTRGPLMFPANIGGDSDQVLRIARAINQFKSRFPDRPLILVGHSGGCRMVVRAMEACETNLQVDRAILLSPGLESTYNLSAALEKSRSGIVSYYSSLDVPISTPLTFVRGLAKRRIDISAAAVGFKIPAPSSRELYSQKLVQQKYDFQMLSTGHPGGHFGWTAPSFVSAYVAPWVAADSSQLGQN